jgi:hypothetical protein
VFFVGEKKINEKRKRKKFKERERERHVKNLCVGEQCQLMMLLTNA